MSYDKEPILTCLYPFIDAVQ